jgi:hypothetical protein
MADKRTPPDEAAGARGRKRAAPTIDLTATEVPSPQPDPPPQQPQAAEPPAADPEPPPAAESRSADNPWTWLGTNTSAPTLAAGAAGAGLVSLVLFGLWLTGLVPIRYAGSTAMRARVAGLEMQVHDLQNRPAGAADTKSLNALSERLSKIETTIAKIPAGDAGVAERLAAADNAMKALGLALTALNRRSDDIAGNAALARERAEAVEKALTELRASVQELAKNTAAGISPGDLDALQKRIAALEQSAKTATTDAPSRLALSAAALRDAAISGAPFAAELAQVKSLGADDKALAPLESYAATGVPTQGALAQELQALIPAMLKASGAQAPAGNFLERLQANAGNLVRIRPVDAPPGDDASAVLARIEIDAARADIAAALMDIGRLSDATRAPALRWIAKAQARQAALAAARQIAADTARALGPKAGAQ